MRDSVKLLGFLAVVSLPASFYAAGCGTNDDSTFATTDDGGNGDGSNTDENLSFSTNGPYKDFPTDPLLDTPDSGVVPPSNAAALFAGAQAAGGGGPCLMEPEVGSMFPRNWLRPRFRWVVDGSLSPDAGDGGGGAGSAENLFELRIHADNQVNNLVVYTTAQAWTMPKEMWDALTQHSAGVPMTVNVRGGVWSGGSLGGVALGSTGPLSIAPVDAPGTIVYWTTGITASGGYVYEPALKGFRVGDESVTEVLRPAQLNPPDAGDAGTFKCLGCHNSTPDGLYVAVSARDHNPGGPPTQFAMRSVDGFATAPSYVTAVAQTLLDRREQDLPVFSPAHFQDGDRVAVGMYSASGGGGPFEIIWTDLEATAADAGIGWGTFARTGDSNHPSLANVSHDGSKILYVSSPDIDTAGTTPSYGDLYTIPYNNRAGGTATPVPGANDPTINEGYPSFSPDDKFIVFTHDPNGVSLYHSPYEELFVIPSSGGTPTRVKANDPPVCSGATSPGIYNSWPKWSPGVRSSGGKDYYFLVFSSERNNAGQTLGAGLYVTPVVVDGNQITTYAALYLWNQPQNEDNHSPAWDEFKIPSPK